MPIDLFRLFSNSSTIPTQNSQLIIVLAEKNNQALFEQISQNNLTSADLEFARQWLTLCDDKESVKQFDIIVSDLKHTQLSPAAPSHARSSSHHEFFGNKPNDTIEIVARQNESKKNIPS